MRKWEYSRTQHSHWAGEHGDGSKEQGWGLEWRIRDCRDMGSIHKPSDGYDLERWGKVVAHASTVKELKTLQERMEGKS